MITQQIEPEVGRDPTGRAAAHRGVDALLLGLLALLLRVPAFLSARQLGFDDGQFAESVLAMRGGGLPYREVFSSQGPLFLPLAWLGDLVTFRTIDSPRTIAVLSGAVLTAAVYLAARELTSRPGAWLAAGLVGISGSVLWTTGPLTSDGPAEALAATAVAIALTYRRRPSTGKAVALGILIGAAFSVKSLLVLPALVAVGLLVLARRRARDVLLVPALAVVVAVVVMLPWGVERVLDQSYRYHTDQAGQRHLGANLTKTLRTLGDRDLPLIAAGIVAVAATVAGLTRRRPAASDPLAAAGSGRRTSPGGSVAAPRAAGAALLDRLTGGITPVVLWAVLALAVLLLEAPMWRNHLAHVVPPVAILIGVACARPRVALVAGVAALVMVPFQAPRLSELLWPGDYGQPAATIVARLRRLPAGARAVSDDPGLVWRAGRHVPDRFVDVSILRIDSPRPALAITERDVLQAAATPVVCAVVQTSRVRFGSFPGLAAGLERLGYDEVLAAPRGHDALWVKRDCRPRGAHG